MGWWTIWADYYDAEFYAQQELEQINISNIPNTWNISDITGDIDTTTGNNSSWGKIEVLWPNK